MEFKENWENWENGPWAACEAFTQPVRLSM
jgi:hypothetical protein